VVSARLRRFGAGGVGGEREFMAIEDLILLEPDARPGKLTSVG